jgi:hypothetical protein
MGGPVSAPRQSPAEATAARLVQTDRTGLAVLIPGAFEKRAASAAPPRSRADALVTDEAHPPVASDRERLEHEREGGGAPSARAGRRSGTLGARLWHSLLHPTQLPDIWRRALPQAS